jgi:hypothetical protein
MERWSQIVQDAITHKSGYHVKKRYSEIYLPVRMWGVWMMLVCDPEDRKTYIVVFNEWEWDHPTVVKPLEGLATQLKYLALEEGLMLQENIREEKKTKFWPFPFSSNEKEISRYGFVKRTVAKFYKTTQNL